MQATITEVAKLAGVSIATVSRVLHESSSVSEDTAKKVNMAIAELGYVPNSIARSLKEQSSFTIGITASDLSVSFFPEVIKRVEEEMLPLGYATMVSSTFDQSETEKLVLEQMLTRRVDALLVNSTASNEEMLYRRQVPIIFYDRRPLSPRFPSVYMDKAGQMKLALNHLSTKGHKKIMLVTGARSLNSNIDRYVGFRQFIAETDSPAENFEYRFGRFTYEDGIKAIEDIVKMPADVRPTAVVTGSIAITAGLIAGCSKYGLQVPGDLAIVSSGNFMYFPIYGYRLTYLDDRIDVLSRELVRLLKCCFEHEKVPQNYEYKIEPLLCEGNTT